MDTQGSSPFLESCLIADNTAGAGGKNLSADGADVYSLDHCLISLFVDGDAALRNSTGAPISPLSPGTNLFNVDARLAPLAFNGGKTQTHKLKKGSPAINHGSLTAVAGLPNLTFDQRGPPFLRQLGPAVDIGAYERQ